MKEFILIFIDLSFVFKNSVGVPLKTLRVVLSMTQHFFARMAPTLSTNVKQLHQIESASTFQGGNVQQPLGLLSVQLPEHGKKLRPATNDEYLIDITAVLKHVFSCRYDLSDEGL